ncbi:hypothetical protein EDD85DRAFT_359055 [Armillaria nabsnona]|nr:hypothetical protein EDD85DRAFT_359055 [Armillaria nabsnona]
MLLLCFSILRPSSSSGSLMIGQPETRLSSSCLCNLIHDQESNQTGHRPHVEHTASVSREAFGVKGIVILIGSDTLLRSSPGRIWILIATKKDLLEIL